MWRWLRRLFILVVIILAALVGYAFLADLSPPDEPLVIDVPVNSE
ncbi:MAG: hypothetical protein OXF74_06400 [Rhodobacteraceae bacterium]|nr:hypothetical protein [Paracoccaceae bacterium]